jgi:WD40 repeat protein
LRLAASFRRTKCARLSSLSRRKGASHVGKLLALGGKQGAICDVAAGSIQSTLPAAGLASSDLTCERVLALDDEGRVFGIAASPRNERSATESEPDRSLIRFAADGKSWETLVDHLHKGASCLSSDRRLFAAAVKTNYGKQSEGIHVWDVHRRARIKECSGQWCKVESLAISPDNRWLASTGSRTGILKVWSLEGAPAENSTADSGK